MMLLGRAARSGGSQLLPILAVSYGNGTNPQQEYFGRAGSGASAKLYKLPTFVGAHYSPIYGLAWSKDHYQSIMVPNNENNIFATRTGLQMTRRGVPTGLGGMSNSSSSFQPTWSPANNLICIPGGGSPGGTDKLVIAQFAGGNPLTGMTRIDGETQPASVLDRETVTYGAKFSRDGTDLLTCRNDSSVPVKWYRTTNGGATWSEKTFSESLPASAARSASFCAKTNGTKVAAVTFQASPFLATVYSADAQSNFNAFGTFSSAPAGVPRAVRYSPDAEYGTSSATGNLAVAHQEPPHVTVYELDQFSSVPEHTKIADPATLPTGNATAIAWSGDSNYLVVGHASPPYVTMYHRNSPTSFTKCPDPDDLPLAAVYDAAWSDNPFD